MHTRPYLEEGLEFMRCLPVDTMPLPRGDGRINCTPYGMDNGVVYVKPQAAAPC